MNRVLSTIRRGLHSNIIKMNAFTERQNQAEKTIALLKQQIEALISIAEQKQKLAEKDEIQRLQKENAKTEKTVLQLKYDLRFFEAQNGVKQVLVPEKEAPVASVPPQETETPKDTKPAQKNQEKKKKENKGPKAPKPDEAAKTIDVSRLNLKIGKIVDVKPHPDADGLFIETVEFGEERPRTILSGLVKHYSLEQMKDRLAIFLCNLKPAKMRGIVSEGMIMCASTPEKVEIVNPPQGASIGDRVFCPQYNGEPDVQLNPKRKIWEQVAPDLHIDAEGFAAYKNQHLIIEGKGKCKAPSMLKCPIK